MTSADTIAVNDRLRTELKGGKLLFSPGVWELDARFRGRLVQRLALYDTFDDDSLHDCGVFVFGGWTFYWEIAEFAEERCLSILMGSEL